MLCQLGEVMFVCGLTAFMVRFACGLTTLLYQPSTNFKRPELIGLQGFKLDSPGAHNVLQVR